jgi:protein-ribulosamine 3-kinase
MPNWSSISQQASAAAGIQLDTGSARSVGGGCINAAYVLAGQQDGSDAQYFIKTNAASRLAMFEAEAAGLDDLASSQSLRIPEALCSGIAGNDAFLLLEYIPLKGSGDDEQFGAGLAAMHRSEEKQFGWQRDNTIGATPQANAWNDDWVRFWAEQRLGAQLELAAQNGAGRTLLQQGEALQAELPAFFSDYQPAASLLHGDLWSGNYAFDDQRQAVIFDPAVYYGDRETDLAMTELFGGFSSTFYAAYNNAWPLDAGYATRKTLYNLYHILNHFNLFGGGYLSQAQGMIQRLLSEVR